MVKVEDLRIGQEVWYVVDEDEISDLCVKLWRGKISQISLHEVKIGNHTVIIENVALSAEEQKEIAKDIINDNYQSRLESLKHNFEMYTKYVENH